MKTKTLEQKFVSDTGDHAENPVTFTIKNRKGDIVLSERKKGNRIDGYEVAAVVKRDGNEVYPLHIGFDHTALWGKNEADALKHAQKRFENMANGGSWFSVPREIFVNFDYGYSSADIIPSVETETSATPAVSNLRQPRIAKAVVDLKIPTKPFTQKDLAAFNGIANYKEVYSPLQKMLADKTLKIHTETREATRGKAAKLFVLA
jgi:hypothetical protein